MSNPTSNFNWQMPTNTDLVSQLPADFEVFGQAVDTSLADLKGGTTGQVLKKNTNADMDFVWAADSAGMTNPMTTTGDTIYSSSGSTPARLGIGSTGQVLTVSGGVPAWAAPASGGMTLINTGGTALTGSSVAISSIPATFNNLQICITGFRPATDGTDIQMRFNSDTGTRYRRINGFSSTSGTFNETSMKISDDTDNGVNTGFITMTITDYANTTTWKSFLGYAVHSDHTTPANADVDFYMGVYNQTAAIDSLTFFPGSGNWTSGTVFVYGVK
jgi:hypothetical protein